MTPTFSVIVPTTGRDTLARALQSLQNQPLESVDEVIVVGDGAAIQATADRFGYRFVSCPPGGNWGCDERRLGISLSTCTHLVFLDDDDVYLPGAFASMRAAVSETPERPIMFKMIAPWGETLWRKKEIEYGNHGTPMFVCPNAPGKVGIWGQTYAGDTDFVINTLALYPPDVLVWNETVIYQCRPTRTMPNGLKVLDPRKLRRTMQICLGMGRR